MHKHSKGNNKKISYPHPTIKSLIPQPEENLSDEAPVYSNYYPKHCDTLSSKMVRSTHTHPIEGCPFSLVLQPLHPAIKLPRYSRQQAAQCMTCRTVLTELTSTQYSLHQMKCLNCMSVHGYGCLMGEPRIKDPSFDYIVHRQQQSCQSSDQMDKHLIIIQANQCLHNVHACDAVIEVLKALKTQNLLNYRFGFIFFNQQTSYWLKLSHNQLVVCAVGEFKSHSFPVDLNDLTTPLSLIDFEWLEQVSGSIMHESAHTRTDCPFQILDQCSLLFQNSAIKIELFVNSVGLGQRYKAYHMSIQLFVFNDDQLWACDRQQVAPFSRRQNVPTCKSKKWGLLKHQFIRENVYRVYSHKGGSQFPQLYYDFHHYLTSEHYYDVKCLIKSSSSRFILAPTSKTSSSKRQEVINIGQVNQNTPIMMDFIPVKQEPKSTEVRDSLPQFIYIEFVLENSNNQQLRRVIIYRFSTLSCNESTEPYKLNDETFFYATMRQLCQQKENKWLRREQLSDPLKDKQNIQDCRKNKVVQSYSREQKDNLTTQLITTISNILEIADSEQEGEGINVIPMNLSHTIMYCYMILQHPLGNSLLKGSYYQRHLFLREGLETIAKQIYPKVYEFVTQGSPSQDCQAKLPTVKCRKFKPNNFHFARKCILVIDDGRAVTVVFGDNSDPRQLIQLLGTDNLEQIISWTDLPHLESFWNAKLRELIEILRRNNSLYYLPLQFMNFDSQAFEDKFGRFLFLDDPYYRFLRRLFRKG